MPRISQLPTLCGIPFFATLAAVALLPGSACSGNQLLKLTSPDAQADQLFGVSVAIDNGTALIGAYGDSQNGPFVGAAHLFNTATGAPVAKLTPADGQFFDNFGEAVALADGYALISSVGSDANGSLSGAAYLYDASSGAQLGKLLPADGAADDRFGRSVAVGEGVALVGAVGDDSGAGSAYLFDLSPLAQRTKLLPTDGTAGKEFGTAVAVGGGRAVVGAVGDNAFAGAAYVFDLTTGVQLAKLVPTDATAGSFFGGAVAIEGSLALVGAWKNDANGVDSGAAYLFDLDTGSQLAKLTPADGLAGNNFGRSVALEQGVAIIGSPGSGSVARGAAYLFDTTTLAQLAKLTPSIAAADNGFGSTVGLDGGFAIIGAPGDNQNGAFAGATYLFSTAPTIGGDFNGDRKVDNGDLNLLLGSWGSSTVPAAWINGFVAPVDNGELNLLLGDWGFGVSTAVPEPTAALLLMTLITLSQLVGNHSPR
ncbi:FG-GAP repeat protein [Botrimarina hoheduenensis]|uniref:FG-GAP repeat protein n=1 Tax=Botrimarina hoheduenensis TaxID=2528000 RepID=A0A5C5W8M1_9BACT|nr:FG-GAP repeat protein [Botrimarina hoheduenensis]TWT46603.1 hypothetical protein Pla111_16990 [Botrimarina hoheduenensis]